MFYADTNQHVANEGDRRGREAMPDTEKKARAVRVRRLREALGMTQEDVANASGEHLDRPSVVKIESGDNAATGSKAQRGLSKAFSLSHDDVVAFLDGDITIDEAMRRRGDARATVVEDDRMPEALRTALKAYPSASAAARAAALNYRAFSGEPLTEEGYAKLLRGVDDAVTIAEVADRRTREAEWDSRRATSKKKAKPHA